MIRWLAIAACVLTVCITASSAFIRHSQAGLAAVSVSADAAAATATADAAAAPGGVAVPPGVRTARALHRVSAMLVGVLVLLIVVFGWASMRTDARVALSFALVDTAFLAWLGRFTPHPVPLVTVANLVGGIALAAAFAWIAAPLRATVRTQVRSATAPVGRNATASAGRNVTAFVFAALVLLAFAAWIGTMIGAHDAIGVCEGARCAGPLRLDASVLDPMRTPQAIDAATARGLHWLHRGVAVVFAVVALTVVARACGNGRAVASAALVVLLLAQAFTGVGTTLGLQPLTTATLHNAFAALLAVTLTAIAAAGPRRAPAPFTSASGLAS